jgi:transcriptional regulator with XRE-family HTH domain
VQIGMSQERLADALGITFQQVQKYEKGTNRVSVGRLHQIAGALEVPLDYFYADVAGSADNAAGAQEVSDLLGELAATPETVALVRGFVRITDRTTRRRIVELVLTIARAGGESVPDAELPDDGD